MKIGVRKEFLVYILYTLLAIILNLVVLILILQIQFRYGSEFIALRFNVYEGITVIDSARYVWQYGVYVLLIAIWNGLTIWYVKQKMDSVLQKNRFIQFIFGATLLTISLVIYYLWLVIRINS